MALHPSKTAPHRSKTAPQPSRTAPHRSRTAPHRSKTAPHRSRTAPQRRRQAGLLAAVASLGLAGALLVPAAASAATGLVRTDQAGYLPTDTKIAYLMASSGLSGETYKVINSAGTTVASGSVTTSSRGSWNSAYPDVYPIDFSAVTTPGTYHVTVSGLAAASSDTFAIESASSLYGSLVSDGVNFFQNERDGSNLAGSSTLNRQPSHLHDASATLYQTPTFIAGSDGGTGDQIKGNLVPVSGASPVNAEGGWFDAGDYLKFTFTTAYADDLLYSSALALGSGAPASLTAEAQYGTSYLNNMWNSSTKTLYLQVGIGAGNETTYMGDHDLWRLPQADDSDTTAADKWAAAHRPVFEAAAPGAKISPDVVGRVAAAFALAAQDDELAGNTSGAQTELNDATSLYAMANTSAAENDTLESTLPEAYYPEGIWHDAMELASTEIVRAEQDLGDPESSYSAYLTQASTWASDYISTDSGQDTLNLYDVSALAHADLITAIKDAGSPSGLAVTTAGLIANLKAQVASAASVSASDIFRAGGDYANFDVDSHSFGFIATEALYQQASGDTQYAAFAGEQRSWLLGGNAWGSSFVAGVGTTYPACMGGQLENLDSPVDVGAVVNGPNGTGNFSGGLGGLLTGMKKCENDSFTAFTGHGAEYVDDVRSWQSSEPAIDMTGAAILAGALQQAVGGTTPPANDFSLSVSPASGTVTAGGSATAAVATAVTSGSAETVALTGPGAPSGATVSFSPASVSSGTSSTMTITTAGTTPAGSYPITVTGTAASGTHSTTYTLTVTSGQGGGCTAGQLLGDPGFENGATITPWTESSTLGFNPITKGTTAEPAHSGSWEAWLNGNGTADTDTVAQPVSIPSGCTSYAFSFWLHVDTTENTTTATPDTLTVQVLSSGGSVLATLATYSNLSHNTGYAQHSFDLSGYAGQSVTLKFTGTETDANGGTTNFVFDDTALQVS
ncbi:MAG TPA: glycoside hydrolase family 9 protein [Streptosporangiaceae bacterium]